MSSKTFPIVTTILAIVAIISLISYLPSRSAKSTEIKMANFPMKIGEWTATDIPLSKRDYEILETTNLIMREYKETKVKSVQLYIVYSEENRKVVHPPEVCYMGSGLTVVEKSVVQLTDSIKATRMVAEKADIRQLVIYWFKAGNLNTDQYLKQQFKVVLGRMMGKKTSGAMIRLSIDIINNDEKAALKTLQEFAAQIEPLLAKYVP